MPLFCVIVFVRPLHQIADELRAYLHEIPPPLFAKQRSWLQVGPDRRAHHQPALPMRVEIVRRGHRHW